jgi:hypothetical protein
MPPNAVPDNFTKSGRYKLKPNTTTKPDYSFLKDMGVDLNAKKKVNDFDNRIWKIQYIERMKRVPFVSWVVAAVKENKGVYTKQPTEIIWHALRNHKVPADELEIALSMVAKSNFGRLKPSEFNRLVQVLKWIPPSSQKQMEELPPDNGMITNEIAEMIRGDA